MKSESDKHGQPDGSCIAKVVERNIEALLEHRRMEEKKMSWQDKVADLITGFTGSMTFVILHLALFGAWILINTGMLPIIPKFDPSFVVLAMVASVEAIFLSTFILITQNRMMSLADRRNELNLQVSLLAEHEITRLIRMTTEISEKLGIRTDKHPELEELSQDVAPEKVLDTIETHEKRILTKNS